MSPDWKRKIGSALLVPWPTGTGAKGNEGVAQTVKRIKNSIGYVEYAEAMHTKLSYALPQNRMGRFIAPETAAFQAAAANVDWGRTNDFHLLLTDVPSEIAYPITTTVFVLMPKTASPRRTGAALDFFRWSLENGSTIAAQLGYVPLPEPLIKQVKGYWTRTFKAGGT